MSLNRNRTIVIAEAGVNHNGDINIAKKLIDIASKSGADYVKFQTFDLDLNYSLKNTSNEKKEWVNNLTLSKKEFAKLFEYCKNSDIEFLSTPFDITAVPSMNPRVEASIVVVAVAVIVVVPITVLTFATTASTRAASAAVLRLVLLTSKVPLMITVGSSASL